MASIMTIENAKLAFKNFAGEERQYNRKGNRHFSIIFEDVDLINQLIDDGWNLKQLRSQDPDKIAYHLDVTVRFDNYPPNIYLLTESNKRKKLLNEDTVACLDHAYIKNADLKISPSHWEVNGKQGVKAYLKEAYITIVEDEFAQKYSDYDEDVVPFGE